MLPVAIPFIATLHRQQFNFYSLWNSLHEPWSSSPSSTPGSQQRVIGRLGLVYGRRVISSVYRDFVLTLRHHQIFLMAAAKPPHFVDTYPTPLLSWTRSKLPSAKSQQEIPVRTEIALRATLSSTHSYTEQRGRIDTGWTMQGDAIQTSIDVAV